MATKSDARHLAGWSSASSSIGRFFSRALKGRTENTAPLSGGVVTLRSDDFEQFEECMKTPRKPSQAMVEAEHLHRQMRKT